MVLLKNLRTDSKTLFAQTRKKYFHCQKTICRKDRFFKIPFDSLLHRYKKGFDPAFVEEQKIFLRILKDLPAIYLS